TKPKRIFAERRPSQARSRRSRDGERGPLDTEELARPRRGGPEKVFARRRTRPERVDMGQAPSCPIGQREREDGRIRSQCQPSAERSCPPGQQRNAGPCER